MYSLPYWTKATENFLILLSRNVQEDEQGDAAAQVLHEAQDVTALTAGESSEGWQTAWISNTLLLLQEVKY